MVTLEVKTKHCFTCGGDGPDEPGVCAECGREYRSVNLQVMPEQEVVRFVRAAEMVKIPPQHQGRAWNPDIFWMNHGAEQNNRNLQQFIANLETVHREFNAGMLPTRSIWIVAPGTYGKEIFAYSCMQKALEKGLTVAPLIDSADAKRIMILASERPTATFMGMEYEDYLQAEVLFVTITKSYLKMNAYPVIEELMHKRERLGLCTFVLSREPIYRLAQHSLNDAKRAGAVPKGVNNVKYPLQIAYLGG